MPLTHSAARVIARGIARSILRATLAVTIGMAGAAGAQTTPTLTVSVIAGNGSIGSPGSSASCSSTCSSPVPYGTVLTLVARPAAGQVFTGWSDACSGTGDCVVTMNSSKRVLASFAAAPPPTRNVNVTLTGSGQVTLATATTSTTCTANCTRSFPSGSSVTLSASPATGYRFSGWGGACSGSAGCMLTLDNDAQVSAAFDAVIASGRTFYVDASAPDDNGSGAQDSPKKHIASGAALLSPNGGDTLLVAPGTYGDAKDAIGASAVPGRAGAWNVIKAAIDGTVIITAPMQLPRRDHYLQLEGLRWHSDTQKSVTGRYVKLLRCGFRNGPRSGNTMNLSIGTNDATPGAQYILVEDAFVYGPGGRYNVLVYNADKVVLRRMVVRHESGWGDTKGDPQASVALYNSTDVLTQNLLIVDSGASGYFEAALYHPSNTRASRNIRNVGAMIFDTAGTAVAWDDYNASSANLLEDSILWKARSAIVVNGAAHAGVINRVTIGKTTQSGINDYRGGRSFTVTNSLLWEVLNNRFSIPHTNNVCYAPSCAGELSMNPAVSGLTWLPRIEPGSALATAGAGGTQVGATVLQRLGESGTLWGEPGYDQPTTQSLWPWPNEAAIRQAMCTDAGISTGFCAATSITRYVWEALGTPMP